MRPRCQLGAQHTNSVHDLVLTTLDGRVINVCEHWTVCSIVHVLCLWQTVGEYNRIYVRDGSCTHQTIDSIYIVAGSL